MKECEKIPFPNREKAQEELVRIVEGNDYRHWKQVSPCRVYKCPLHGDEEVWHLTSQPTTIEY